MEAGRAEIGGREKDVWWQMVGGLVALRCRMGTVLRTPPQAAVSERTVPTDTSAMWAGDEENRPHDTLRGRVSREPSP
jgi:hypothetical protein